MKFFISGPSASVIIEVVNKKISDGLEISTTIENIIEKFCRLTGDLEEDYTATIIN